MEWRWINRDTGKISHSIALMRGKWEGRRRCKPTLSDRVRSVMYLEEEVKEAVRAIVDQDQEATAHELADLVILANSVAYRLGIDDLDHYITAKMMANARRMEEGPDEEATGT